MTPLSSYTVRMLDWHEHSMLANVAPDVFDGPINPTWCADFLADPRHHLAVALEGDTVVGMASGVHYVHPDKPPELWVNEVGVAPAHQKQGLGKVLMETLFAHARTLGCAEAWVLTEDDNTAARRLYARAGGTEAPEKPVYVTFSL